MMEEGRSTQCIVFTDVVGSTKRWAADPASMASDLERHDVAIRTSIEAHGGFVFATGGDGFACAFSTAASGVAAAIAVQRALAGIDWDGDDALLVRIGVHAGEVIERGGDFFGPTVNAAARLMSAAHGGQIVVSGAALPDRVARRDLGEHRFRDVAQPMRVYQIVADGLATDFPPLESLDRFTSTLPSTLSSFVGRAAEIERVRSRLANHRLVTITGVGGVGKTRLAIETAAAEQAHYPGGVYFADLTSVADPAAVPTAVASGVGLLTGSDPMTDLARFGRGERPMLIVLDNCEHLLDSVADLVHDLLTEAPSLRILATSREALDLDGEGTFRVPSMDPATTGLRLFVERATAVDDTFVLDDHARPLVEQICGHLDGIPLAIELAATRTRSMGLADILAGIEDRFSLLSGGRRGRTRRQRTLEATIGWSYELLDEDERRFFRRLGVFVGPFVVDVVAEVTECSGARTRDLLDSLVAKSLVVVSTSEGVTTYRLLETVRSYALDRLADHDETMPTAERHERAYVEWQEQMDEVVARAIRVESYSLVDLFTAQTGRVEQAANLAAAADHAIDNGRLARAVALTCVMITDAPTAGRRESDRRQLLSLMEFWDELDTSWRTALALRLTQHFVDDFNWAEVGRYHALARRHREDAPLLARISLDAQTSFLGTLTDPARAVETIPRSIDRWTDRGILMRPLVFHLVGAMALCRRFQDAYDAVLADVAPDRSPRPPPMACQGLWLGHFLGLPAAEELLDETDEVRASLPYRTSILVARAIASAPTPNRAAQELVEVADQIAGRVPFEEADVLLGFARVAHLLGEDERAIELLDCTVDRGTWSVWVAAETRAAITGEFQEVWNPTALAAEVNQVPGELARRHDEGPRMLAEEVERWRSRHD